MAGRIQVGRTRGQYMDLDRLHTPYHDDPDSDDEAPPNFQMGGAPWNDPPISSVAGGGVNDETPGGVMIHMVPEGSKTRWSHIDDLDSFFKKVYKYHQKSGFKCMILQEFFELLQFVFIVLLTVFLLECVNYPILFHNKFPKDKTSTDKITLSDVTLPAGECMTGFSFATWFCLLVAFVFWITRALAVFYHVFQFWDIKSFYNNALKIQDSDLESVTWHEVQKRLVEAQTEHLMCIHKDQLTELDIYHRILRYKNYMVAMINKDLLPVRLNLPFCDETVFLSQGLKFNFEFLFFKGPWAPFNQWHLKEDYKRVNKKKELVEYLQSKMTLLAAINFALMPIILLWQILYFFFNYAELIKREPGALGVRKWSQYGRLYLRHFNELEHELKVRLNRAYKPANQYMEIFVSPLSSVIAGFIAFVAGSILAVFIVLTVWDEDVLNVEHVITLMTALGAVVAVCRVFIPDEHLVFCPEKCLTSVLAHIHYFPLVWKGQAHTYKTMGSLSTLFPYTAVYLAHELVSPIVTPFILFFGLRPRAHLIVDFFRNFTVDVVGVGDVCSFAQMDVRKHGNPNWQTPNEQVASPQSPPAKTNQYTRAEDGKTEMSLVHFTLTHPAWRPPQQSSDFIANLRDHAAKEAEALATLPEENLSENALYSSLTSLDEATGAAVYSSLIGSLTATAGPNSLIQSVHNGLGRSSLLASAQAPPSASLLQSRLSLAPPPNLRQDLRRLGMEYTSADMSLSALYLHEMHHRLATRRTEASRYDFQRRASLDELEEEPLIETAPVPPRLSSSATMSS